MGASTSSQCDPSFSAASCATNANNSRSLLGLATAPNERIASWRSELELAATPEGRTPLPASRFCNQLETALPSRAC
eukprot:11505572-Alexandrium_andersonii.AAC.1